MHTNKLKNVTTLSLWNQPSLQLHPLNFYFRIRMSFFGNYA